LTDLNGQTHGRLAVGKVLKSVAIAAVIVGIGVATGGIGFAPTIGSATTAVGGGIAVAGATTAAVAVTTATVVGSSLAFTALGSALAAMAISTVLSGVTAQLFGPKMPKAQASRLNPSLDPQATRKFVFGETAMNTDIRYFEPSGTDQEYFDFIIATSAHEVESIDSIWFDDREAWRNGYGVITPYVGYLTVTPITAGTAANYITINSGDPWGSTCRLTGCSYVHLRIKRTGSTSKVESPLVNGLPSRVTIKGKGAKLYDPRRDSTVAGGSGAERADQQTTWGSGASTNRDNPALQLLWFLLGWDINSKLSVGCGIPPARIDLPSFITAANICDEAITLAAGGTQPRYRTAGVGSDADNRMEIIQILLTSMNATLRDSNGKLSITVMKNDLATPVLEFDDNDILGDFTWNQTRGLNESMNAVHGKYTDPSNDSLYQPVEYPVISIASVDGIERMQTLDLPWVQEGRRAQRIAKQVLQRAQYKGIFSATFSMKALGCEVGDIVYISFEPLGWADKPFRVLTQGINNTGQVPMTLIEENAAIYAWDADEQAIVTPTAPTIYDPLNSPYILAISDAEAAADGKIVSFYQASAPTAQGVGDLWFDTDAGNKPYRWNGAAWVDLQDTAITTAIQAASDAQATADGKINTYFQASAPTPEAVGDLWIETDAQNRLWRWNGSTWQLSTDTRVTAAINTDGTISNSAVITSSIASNAVSKLTAASGTTSVLIGSSWTVIQTVTITTSGGPLVVRANFQNYSQPIAAGTNGIEFYLSSNGGFVTQFYYSTQYAVGGGAAYQFRQQCTLETLAASIPAGTYTVEVLARLTNTNSQASTMTADRVLTVTELKR
jgi:Putative phage tail protein